MSAPSSPANFGLAARRPLDVKWLVIAIATLAAAYLAMLNRYWVPSGDGEVYTCIARSLVQVNKLLFNGSKAAIAPPGWPLVLSWLMRISPEFWFLKLAIILSMLGGLTSAFFVVRRFVATDRAAAGIIILTGTLSSVYPLTYWTHTESFFCLLGFAAILIAFRISEGRARLFWEVPAMLALLGFGAFTRWPGLLHAVLVIPILLSGPKRRPWRRASAWAYIAAVILVCGGTFKITYEYLKLTKQEQKRAEIAGAVAEVENPENEVAMQPTTIPTTGPTTTTATTGPVVRSNDPLPDQGDVFGTSRRHPVMEVLYRIGTSGRWFSWLFWQPTRFGQSVHFIDACSLIFGWLSIILLATTMWRAAQRREFFWIGLAIYTGGLCVLWPNPNARYFVPVAPFLVLGVLRGIGEMSTLLAKRAKAASAVGIASPRSPTASSIGTLAYADANTRSGDSSLSELPVARGAWRGLAFVFVIVTLLFNLPLLAIDIRVFRSHDFYGKYEAGANQDLMAIASYINAHPVHPPEEQIAVDEKYDNMGRWRYSKFGIRALHLLTGQQVIPTERKNKYAKMKPDDEDMRKALKRNSVTFCVLQNSWTPWRVWHFRLTPGMQEWLTKKPVPNQSGGWEIWGRVNARYEQIDDVPKSYVAPTRVPGL